jgi:hypothetical protein
MAMSKIDSPFRADHVGSLLRPPAIHAALGHCLEVADGICT